MAYRKIDPRSLAALTYSELAARSPRSCTALLWTRACGVIRRDDLFRVTWPDIPRRRPAYSTRSIASVGRAAN
jgi:hypothetical protein